jgi:hypothetical protein
MKQPPSRSIARSAVADGDEETVEDPPEQPSGAPGSAQQTSHRGRGLVLVAGQSEERGEIGGVLPQHAVLAAVPRTVINAGLSRCRTPERDGRKQPLAARHEQGEAAVAGGGSGVSGRTCGGTLRVLHCST